MKWIYRLISFQLSKLDFIRVKLKDVFEGSKILEPKGGGGGVRSTIGPQQSQKLSSQNEILPPRPPWHFHSCNHQKRLPYQFPYDKTVMKIQIDETYSILTYLKTLYEKEKLQEIFSKLKSFCANFSNIFLLKIAKTYLYIINS